MTPSTSKTIEDAKIWTPEVCLDFPEKASQHIEELAAALREALAINPPREPIYYLATHPDVTDKHDDGKPRRLDKTHIETYSAGGWKVWPVYVSASPSEALAEALGKVNELLAGRTESNFPKAESMTIIAQALAMYKESSDAAPPEKLKFPVMIRKMWSGGEIQEWLDRNYTPPSAVQAVSSALADFADSVKQLCRDFSSRTGNVYIKDVESSIDGLLDQHTTLPALSPQDEAVGEFIEADGDNESFGRVAWYEVEGEPLKTGDKIYASQQPSNDVVVALGQLVELKSYKDKNGKDAYYEAEQPKAWAKAIKALVNYKPKSTPRGGMSKV